MMSLYQKVKPFLGSLSLLVILNLLIKPVWIFWIDREVQNRAGLSDYGVYFALINLSMVFNFLLDLGVTSHVNREVATKQTEATVLIEKALSYKIFLSFLYSACIMLMAWVTGVSNFYLLGLLIVLQILISLLLFFRAGLTASGLFWQDSVMSILDKLCIIIVAGIWLLTHKGHKLDIHQFVWLQLITTSVTLMAAYVLLKNKISFTFFQFPKLKKETIISALPYALNYFFMTALLRGDGFLIDRLSGAHDAGIYAAAFRLVDAVNMFGFLFAAFLVSYIAREGINQETAFILRITRTFLLIPAVLLSAMGWFYSDKINEILYYSSSTQTTEVIRILLLCLPALALVHIYGSVLTAAGEIKLFRNISGMMSLLLVLTDIAFIPRYGILSAAWVAVVFQSVYALIVMWYAISKKELKTYLVDLIVIMGTGLVLWISLNS